MSSEYADDVKQLRHERDDLKAQLAGAKDRALHGDMAFAEFDAMRRERDALLAEVAAWRAEDDHPHQPWSVQRRRLAMSPQHREAYDEARRLRRENEQAAGKDVTP